MPRRQRFGRRPEGGAMSKPTIEIIDLTQNKAAPVAPPPSGPVNNDAEFLRHLIAEVEHAYQRTPTSATALYMGERLAYVYDHAMVDDLRRWVAQSFNCIANSWEDQTNPERHAKFRTLMNCLQIYRQHKDLGKMPHLSTVLTGEGNLPSVSPSEMSVRKYLRKGAVQQVLDAFEAAPRETTATPVASGPDLQERFLDDLAAVMAQKLKPLIETIVREAITNAIGDQAILANALVKAFEDTRTDLVFQSFAERMTRARLRARDPIRMSH